MSTPRLHVWLAALGVVSLSLNLRGDAAPTGASRPFITVSGARLMEGSRPFYFVGANLNVMHGERARTLAASTIAAAAADGLQVGRIWAFGEGEAGASPWKRRHTLFRHGPDGWLEAAFVQLDRVIAEAGKRRLRLVVTLSNHWKDRGGIPTYLGWVGHKDREAHGFTDRFFSEPRCRRWFAEHLRRVVGRTNSVTGLRYRDDPTILSWELQNELHGAPKAAAQRRQWYVEMARLVRELDPNHLVVPGVLGYDLQREREAWIAMNRLPEVAYCDQHFYADQDLRRWTSWHFQRYVDDRVQLAHHVLNKPIVFGEFGFAGSVRSRTVWHARLLRALFFDGGNGALAWIYQPTLKVKRRHQILIDDRRHRGLRAALGRAAGRVGGRRGARNRNRRLGPARGARPLAPTHLTWRRRARPHDGWSASGAGTGRARSLRIPVDQFHQARFEIAGTYDEEVLVHSYGRRTGWFDYRFVGPSFTPAALVIRARLSSEYPESAPPDGVSAVKVLLDGVLLQQVRAVPDDGVGTWHAITVRDPALLKRLRRGRHTLRLRVVPGPAANGVAIYGRATATNKEPVTAPGPLTITATP